MHRKIRITIVSLMVMIACMISSVGTLSYFTDTDGATNSFTVGNASTVLSMYDDVSGDEKREFDASRYSPLTDGMDDIPFYLQATNSGNIPVYQRFRVVIPIGLEDVVTLKLPTDESCNIKTVDGHKCSNDDYNITYKPYNDEANKPAEYDIVSMNALSVTGVGSVTREWPTVGIKINGISDANKDLFECVEGNDNNCTFGIKVYSNAIQTTGFTDAVTAFENFTETNE